MRARRLIGVTLTTFAVLSAVICTQQGAWGTAAALEVLAVFAIVLVLA